MAENDRMFSAIAAYAGKLPNVELRNDLQAGTMTVVFKSPVPTDGEILELQIYGTRNVEIRTGAEPEWQSFRRCARVYADALELLDCFHLIEVEPTDHSSASTGKAGLRIARSSPR